MQTPPEMLRDMQARDAAIRRYAAAHDKFAEIEQKYTMTDPTEAYGAAVYAAWCLRAVRAEMDDREPRPTCDCRRCIGGKP